MSWDLRGEGRQSLEPAEQDFIIFSCPSDNDSSLSYEIICSFQEKPEDFDAKSEQQSDIGNDYQEMLKYIERKLDVLDGLHDQIEEEKSSVLRDGQIHLNENSTLRQDQALEENSNTIIKERYFRGLFNLGNTCFM